MLDKVDLSKKLSRTEFRTKYNKLEKELIHLQREVLDLGIPVIVTFEGWSASGKGTLINDLTLPMDPRGFRVIGGRTKQDEISYLVPYWKNSPPKGFISIFGRSWYRPAIEDIFKEAKPQKKFIRDAINFERQHLDSDTLIIKFFLHISQKEQQSRLKELTNQEATAWRVNEADMLQNIHYDKFRDACDDVIGQTSQVNPWVIVEAEDGLYAKYKVVSTITDRIKKALKDYPQSTSNAIKRKPQEGQNLFKNIDLDKKLRADEYRKKFHELTYGFREMTFDMFRKKVPIVIVYEGCDAAGKGGSIRRLTQFFDPRNYNVIPVAAPTKVELRRNYLWRFWKEFPEKGGVSIFDRSWYGRVLVERLEGFCRPDDWKRAYHEINEVEKHLVDQGVLLIKFWLEISQEEQLHRFQKRLNTPHKQWKITEEDWRNREKWDIYRPAVDEMIRRTSTEWAPWTIVEANDKQYARIKTIKTVREAMEKRLY